MIYFDLFISLIYLYDCKIHDYLSDWNVSRYLIAYFLSK